MLHHAMGCHTAALPLFKQALAVNKEALGEMHPHYAHCLNNLAALHQAMGDNAAALLLAERALAIHKEVLGQRHPDYATSLNNLASLHKAMGDHAAALPLYREALKVREAALGRKHPDFAQSLNNLAELHQSMGDHAAALPLYREALKVYEAALGRKHPSYATSLNNLAVLHSAMGDHKTALLLIKRVLAIRKEALGERHPHYANSLDTYATLHQAMGDNAAALPLFREALKVREAAVGRRHPDYATSLNNLAMLHQAMGDNAAALPLAERALAIREEVLGQRHPDYATSLNNLAVLLKAMGDHKAAQPLLERILAINKEVQGERHPDHAGILNNLAELHREMGDHAAALPLYREALKVTEAALGRRHPSYATSLNNLAGLHRDMGRPGTALLLQEQSLAVTRHNLADNAGVQSERQQFAAVDALRYRLDHRLSLPDEAARFSHQHVLSWKGAVYSPQQARRAFVVASKDPATRAIAQKLLDATRSLALVSAQTDPASLARQRDFTRVKEEHEARLAELSEPFRAALQPPSSEAFRSSLPTGTVLIDFLSYTGYDPDRPPTGQRAQHRLAAWIVRRDVPTIRIDLGPMGPIERDIHAWRAAIEQGRDGGPVPLRLRKTLWLPIEKHLGAAKAVLISPDGTLGTLPFAALPGKKGTYLIEDVPLAFLPIPQALPRILEPVKGKSSMLALGGVGFGAGDKPWPELRATGPEAVAVAAGFRKRFDIDAVSLSGTDATRAALREALPKYRFAHLATHGYFAPSWIKSALDREGRHDEMFGRVSIVGWNPALLSGLVLAGANSPTAENDGVLTAQEIGELDLTGMELAVLSACQTGLGKVAGGEGMLGLQRAFTLAGCRTVVSSLWSVEDAATSVLMERFYFHLWEKKLSKLEAVRQAQLEVMRNPRWVEEREKMLAKRGIPRLRSIGVAEEVIVAGKREQRHSPVVWWGAWQLSGATEELSALARAR